MDYMMIVNICTAVITGASIILKVVAPYTKTDKDDKLLNFLNKGLEILSLNTNTKD